ncbi:MAG TPA: HD domain-containing protein [Planctomycetota bacterium]|nr:HD domain-containing protein [Planctomycetota bacterium]
MSKIVCPGQDTRFWDKGDIFDVECAHCGYAIEFFRDDGSRRCPRCGRRVANPRLSLGCAQWCEQAEKCLGFDPKKVQLEEYAEESLADQLVEAVKTQFGADQKRLAHALRVLENAQGLLRHEAVGSPSKNPREAATPTILAAREERGGGDAMESIVDDERQSVRPEVAASLRVAAAAGRLRRRGSSAMPSAASPASPLLAPGPLPPATQPTGILGQAPSPRIVVAAALLHDIGIQEAERKHGSAAGRFQELEGPPIARRILEGLDFAEADIQHICRIVGSHHSGGDIDSPEFRIVWDADWLVNFPEQCAKMDVGCMREFIEKTLRTETGRALAIERFLSADHR